MTNSVQMLAKQNTNAMNNAIAAKIQQDQKAAQSSATQTAVQSTVPYDKRYSSPVIAMDSNTGLAMLQFRDSLTGKETYQIPDKATLAYEKAQTQAAPSVQASGKASADADNDGDTDKQGQSDSNDSKK